MAISGESLPPVARTAVSAASQRAEEHRRPDRLFEDPYAQAFVVAAGGETHVSSALATLFYSHLVVRTRFYDDYLRAAGRVQVVLLAAGLDTRAFRLDWPAGTRLFELDMPEVLDFKEQVLARETPRCARTTVPTDLRADWANALCTAGFDSDVPTAWLAEGVMVYLSHDHAAGLLTTVSELSAPGSRLAFEHRTRDDDDGILAHARGLPGAEGLTALLKGGLAGNASEWLAGYGWRSRVQDRCALAAAYGRPADDPGGDGFLTAERS